MRTEHTPVLIVGGSLVGLTTSALLAHHGVPHIVVEHHGGTAIHPRAASFHQRTMEAYRSVGLQKNVEEAAAAEFEQGGAIVAVESLGGKELKYFYKSYNDGVEGLSPTDRLFVTQVGLEPVIRARAEELGADVRFNHDFVSFREESDGIHAIVRPRDGDEFEIVSDHLIGADGAHSSIRRSLGIDMVGRGGFADCVTIYFNADARPLMGDRNLSVIYVINPKLFGFFRFSIDTKSGFLAVLNTTDENGVHHSPLEVEDDEAAQIDYVRTALGSAPDLPVEVVNVQNWTAAADTATSFGSRRVHLVGDAAHVMPPTGGFGGNTGIADAQNLAWKIAMVHHGRAGAALLDTYEAERRPIAAFTVEQAYTRYVLRVDPELPRDNLADPADDPSIELGGIHRSAAVIGAPGEEAGIIENPRDLSWHPGTRVPHEVTADGGSTLDWARDGFALAVAPGLEDWQHEAKTIATERGLDINVVVSDGEETAPEVVLVRPDGVIAWTVTKASGSSPSELRGVLSTVLALPAA